MPNSVSGYSNVSDLNSYLRGEVPSDTLDQTVANLMSTSTNGIEGVPYQFMPSVDRRVNGTSVGRKYAEKIFSRMPLLFLTPCEPVFMDDFNKGDKNIIANAILGNVSYNDAYTLLGIGANQQRYYSVDFSYSDYYDTLNVMLSCLAIYMGIQDEQIPINGTYKKISQVDWRKELNDDFKTFFASQENLVFYLDSLDSVSESFSNETTESSLSGMINGFSDTVNEIKFLFGSGNSSLASALANAGTEATSALSSGLSSAAQGLAGGIVGSVAENMPMMEGGKIVFPKIWSNSSYEKSYQLDIKLRSPDHDSLSIFLNVLKPYCKLLALTLPREITTSSGKRDPNSYRTPFLVRAAVKGMISVDMGIISSLSVSKGAQCCWNDDGLPTQIDISLTIDDLYSSIHTNSFDGSAPWKNLGFFGHDAVAGIVQNTAYQDFLANTAGLNIAQMEMGRKVRMYYHLTGTYLTTEFSRIGNKLDNTVSRLINKLYNTI